MPKLKGAGMAVEGRQADDAELSAATRAPALAPVQPIVVWLYLAQSLPITASTAVSVGAGWYLDPPLHETSTALARGVALLPKEALTALIG